jgi:hypothetical protein
MDCTVLVDGELKILNHSLATLAEEAGKQQYDLAVAE